MPVVLMARAALDRRSATRLALLFLGAVLARGRRTVTTWIRAAKLSDRFQSCYIAVAAAGKRSDRIARRLLTEVVEPLVEGAERLTLALDDTPTRRYGPHVQGAGIHHNPAPGRPARPTSTATSSSSSGSSPPTRRGA
jgi:DDE superfamily endonuclease